MYNNKIDKKYTKYKQSINKVYKILIRKIDKKQSFYVYLYANSAI